MILVMLAATFFTSLQTDDLHTQYEKAYHDEELTEKMIEHLEHLQNRTPIETAYLGAFNMLMAHHSDNPFSKLGYFQEGKEWIAEAVNANPDHIEIRYLRLVNQVETPKILGYKSEIKEDKKLILTHLEEYRGTDLYKKISKYLKQCDALTDLEKEKIEHE